MQDLQRSRKLEPLPDILRGLAILLVILGHSLTVSDRAYYDSFVFRIIWSLQMPLFFLVSGYLMKYAKTVDSAAAFGRFLGKKTLQLVYPWLFWTIVVRGLICGESSLLDFKWLVTHMDAAYWFLICLFLIELLFSVSLFLSTKICKTGDQGRRQPGAFGLVLVMLLCVLGVGRLTGYAFLGLKYVLYYSLFFCLGAAYGFIGERAAFLQGQYADVLTGLCGVIWLLLMKRFSLFYLEGIETLWRVLASLTGCVFVVGLSGKLSEQDSESRALGFIKWCGSHSLEMYLVHYLLLLPIRTEAVLSPVAQLLLPWLNYLLTVFLTCAFARIVQHNLFLQRLLFFRKPRTGG